MRMTWKSNQTLYKEKIVPMKVAKHLHGICRLFILGHMQVSIGQDTEQPALRVSALSRRLG